jgi:hypothetical protein
MVYFFFVAVALLSPFVHISVKHASYLKTRKKENRARICTLIDSLE